jgi:hypothetical protein
MKPWPKDAEPLAEATLKRMAYILGEQSAAAKALKDIEGKREQGLNPSAFYSRSAQMIFVADIGRV